MKKFLGFYKRKVLLFFIDFLIITICCIGVYGAFDVLNFMQLDPLYVMSYSILLALLCVIFMAIFGIYRNIWRFASSAEILKCAVIITVVWAVVFVTVLVSPVKVRASEFYMIFSYEFSAFAVMASRIVYKSFYFKYRSCEVAEKNVRTLIVGAGFAGHIIISEMLQPEGEYKPVAIVDDDLNKIGRSVHGIPVVGNIKTVPDVAKKYKISKIIIAIPSCSAKDRKKILDICGKTNCEVRLLPYMHKLIANENFLGQIKDIRIEDLLGREPIKFDENKNRELIQGKVCMVTGGGGSIGSELCRQIAENMPDKLVIVDIYENNAYEIQQELLREYGDRLDLDVRIASVRDFNKLDKLFEEFRPQLVFHAAAHKHVPLMEDSPAEAVKNNIFGTYNAARLAEKYECEKFVLVSTDKAVNPTNVMGATKRCCEMIVEYMKQVSEKKAEFVAVRFGNVLGSNGSVVPLFREQIKNGGPVTVTHPDIIRFFMTIPEATSLILQAASFAHGGEIFVLDMGEPVKILSLAENVIKLSGKKPYEEIKIEFTGLRPGEKLYEELLMGEEGLSKTESQKIFIGKQSEIKIDEFVSELDELHSAAEANDAGLCVALLHKIVPTFKRKKN